MDSLKREDGVDPVGFREGKVTVLGNERVKGSARFQEPVNEELDLDLSPTLLIKGIFQAEKPRVSVRFWR